MLHSLSPTGLAHAAHQYYQVMLLEPSFMERKVLVVLHVYTAALPSFCIMYMSKQFC